MHLFTLCLLAIFFPQMLVGMEEAKTWDDFEKMMGQKGQFVLMSASTPVPNDNTKEIAGYCAKHPQFKCYYMVEAVVGEGQPANSFNKHFNNPYDIIVFYKDGVQKSVIFPDNLPNLPDEMEKGFQKAS
nr:putative salivary protein [Nilaparvata lugens]